VVVIRHEIINTLKGDFEVFSGKNPEQVAWILSYVKREFKGRLFPATPGNPDGIVRNDQGEEIGLYTYEAPPFRPRNSTWLYVEIRL